MRISDWSSDVCSSDVPALNNVSIDVACDMPPRPGKNLRAGSVESYNKLHIQHMSTSSQYGFPKSSSRVPWGPSRSEEHTSELQSLMRISYAVFCLQKKKTNTLTTTKTVTTQNQ